MEKDCFLLLTGKSVKQSLQVDLSVITPDNNMCSINSNISGMTVGAPRRHLTGMLLLGRFRIDSGQVTSASNLSG